MVSVLLNCLRNEENLLSLNMARKQLTAGFYYTIFFSDVFMEFDIRNCHEVIKLESIVGRFSQQNRMCYGQNTYVEKPKYLKAFYVLLWTCALLHNCMLFLAH